MVLLYTEGEKVIGKSGLGKAIKHQMIALDEENVLILMIVMIFYILTLIFLSHIYLPREPKNRAKK